jgi:hypothetical protein
VVDPTSVGGYGPAPSAIFKFISIFITIYFISLHYFISGLHVLGMERALHVHHPCGCQSPINNYYEKKINQPQ